MSKSMGQRKDTTGGTPIVEDVQSANFSGTGGNL